MRILTLIVSMLLAANATAGGWSHYGGDLAGSRYVARGDISTDNIDALAPGWVFRSGDMNDGSDNGGDRSSFKATPILVGRNLVFPTAYNRVFAVDGATGKKQWVFDPQVDFSRHYAEMYTARGVAAWRDPAAAKNDACATRILLGTLDARLIAIDAAGGKRCASFGRDGEIDLSVGVRNFRRGEYSLTSPVTVVNDVIVAGSSVGDNGGVAIDSGVVRGFDARSGELLWRWDPVPGSADAPGADTWGADGGAGTGGANVWSIMSADAERGLVYLPTTSPAPDFFGGKRPGQNRFANSVVALDVASGKRRWDFQVVHHDLWDYDIASQPLLLDITRDGRRIPSLVQATKMGHVFVLDRETGKPVFGVAERPVPQSDVAGETSFATQPVPVQPPPLHDNAVRVWNFSEEHAQFCRALLDGVRYDGIFTPPAVGGTLLFPGNVGGTNWGSMAAHPEHQVAVVAVNRLPTVVELIPRAAFDKRRRDAGNDPVPKEYTAQAGTAYGMARFELYNPKLGLPCLEGPWGELVALDMRQGTVLWRRPLGVFPGLEKHPQGSRWGSLAGGGPMITSSGLVFIAPRFGHDLVAYRLDDGSRAWRGELPAMATATPMSYVLDGRQYVVIAAGGDIVGGEPPGDFLVAFALREGATDTP